MSKVYLAGKVTGLPYAEVTMKFGFAQKTLERMGFTVVNPLQVVSDEYAKHPHVAGRLLDVPWIICMRWCIAALTTCDVAVFLDDWIDSNGAQIERMVCQAIRMPVFDGCYDPKLQPLAPHLFPKTPR